MCGARGGHTALADGVAAPRFLPPGSSSRSTYPVDESMRPVLGPSFILTAFLRLGSGIELSAQSHPPGACAASR